MNYYLIRLHKSIILGEVLYFLMIFREILRKSLGVLEPQAITSFPVSEFPSWLMNVAQCFQLALSG